MFGISSDSAESHKKFKEHYNLPFSLLVDDKVSNRLEYSNYGVIIFCREKPRKRTESKGVYLELFLVESHS